MSRRTIVIGSQLFTAAMAFVAAAVLALPAHAQPHLPACDQYGFPGDVGADGKPWGTANGAYFDSALPLDCVATPPGATQPEVAELAVAQPVAAQQVTTNVGAAEMEALVNDARIHPELYPPRGDPTGAAMAPCDGPFLSSQALADTAASHNDFLASQPVEWVMTRPHMHASTPDGMQMSTDAGAPIDQAGFHSLRAQIVAMGYPTATAVVQAWMQDDGPLAWGHRNIILNCALSQAGAAYLQGGPGGHYWTVNLGNP
jgi:hypothetical protein